MGVQLRYKTIMLLFFFLAGSLSGLKAKDLKQILDLEGKWYFSIGDNADWAKPEFNHSQWEIINVPDSWERQGFNGYNGYAWYRKSFSLAKKAENVNLYLSMGYIDDVDEVYLNGQLIGQTGSFPFEYSTAYNAHRLYPIPDNLLNDDGNNVIAVRVYDSEGEGGIVRGTIGVMQDENAIPTDFSLLGTWKFLPKDLNVEGKTQIDFTNWDDIIVPGVWENQGYKNLDGIACYGITFELKGEFTSERMVLLLGKIDDADKVYLNGVLVGQSGEFSQGYVSHYSNMYAQSRGYYLPEGVLNYSGTNLLIVKVFDSWSVGGIYEGSIGLITQTNYINFWRKRRSF